MAKSLLFGIFVVVVMIWVFYSLTVPPGNRQNPGEGMEAAKMYPLLPVEPAEVGTKLTDTIIYTFDVSKLENWAFFDFSRGSIVSDVFSFENQIGWDLAFRRAKIASNGGKTNENGLVEIARLNTIDFDSVTSAPEGVKFVKDTRRSPGADPKNPNLVKWYSYNFMNHNLKSYKSVYIVKTAEGNYAKMQILNYTCKNGEESIRSCYTIKYVYQGDGSKSFVKEVSESLKGPVKKTG